VRLTDARLNLIERYMIDAEEAQAREQAARAQAEQAAAEAKRAAMDRARLEAEAEDPGVVAALSAENGRTPSHTEGADLPIYAWVQEAKKQSGTERDAEWPRALVEAERADAALASDRQ
jgi:hypothetical protein